MSRRGVICLLAAVSGLLLLTSAAGAGGSQVEVLVVSRGTQGCAGFLAESLSGTVTGCVPFAGGDVYGFDPAADGSLVIDNWPNGAGGNIGEGTPVWLMHSNGNTVVLDASDYDSGAAISADGSKVAFVRTVVSTGARTMYVVNADGSGLHLVASGDEGVLGSPALSPDGGSIAYWCSSPDSSPHTRGCGPLPDGSYRESGLMLMNADGTDRRMIVIGPTEPHTNQISQDNDLLSWSPDGKWLTTAELSQVFAYRTDGSDLFMNWDASQQVTHDKQATGPPQFCGSGSQILYGGGGGPYSSYYLIDRNGTHRQRRVLYTPEGTNAVCVPPAGRGGPPPTVNAMQVTVPSVRTLSFPAAKRRLHRAGLHAGPVKWAHSARVPRGHVIAQYPRAGAHAHRTNKEGPPVELVLSRGPRP